MSHDRYTELVKLIDQCENDGHLNAARALVQAYRLQRGGLSRELQSEIAELSNLINQKQYEFNRLQL
jgi:hypothetical protein